MAPLPSVPTSGAALGPEYLCWTAVQSQPPQPRPRTQQSQRRPRKQAGTGLLPETLTWARPAGSPRPLVGIGLADGVDLQSIHANPGVEDLGGDSEELTKDGVRDKEKEGSLETKANPGCYTLQSVLAIQTAILLEAESSRNFPSNTSSVISIESFKLSASSNHKD